MSLELFKKGPRRILEDSKNPGESWKLSKQEMKIFMPLPGQRSKTYFKKCFSFVPRGFKIDFQDRKRNDPNRKLNYFSYISLWPKNFFYKGFSYVPRGSKIIFKIGNEIILKGNGIISSSSRTLIEQLLLQNIAMLSSSRQV